MSTPEVRLSPDGQDVAVNIAVNLWKSTGSATFLADVHVRDWTPLLPVSNEDSRVDCPWCGKPGRKLTASGAMRRHGKPVFPPQDCPGSGRKPSEFIGGAA